MLQLEGTNSDVLMHSGVTTGNNNVY
jgi:hypothetical protein